jgi:hypothetical protein
MKKTFLLLILGLNSLSLMGQTIKKGKVSISTVGGSYYDVPAGHDIDKYGPERISPSGISFKGTLESDELGSLYFRKINVNSADDGAPLENQTLLRYESPDIKLKKYNDNLKMVLRGDLVHYSEKDHFLYLKVDPEFNSEIDSNIDKRDGTYVDQAQTFVTPMLGWCYQNGIKINDDLDLQGFAELSLAPIAFMNHSSSGRETRAKNNSGLGAGGEIVIDGIAKYKDNYYLKVRLEQNHLQGLVSNKPSVTNRMLSGRLGYQINSNLSADLGVENTELVFSSEERRAIGVYNMVGVGLTYKIPSRKKAKLKAKK